MKNYKYFGKYFLIIATITICLFVIIEKFEKLNIINNDLVYQNEKLMQNNSEMQLKLNDLSDTNVKNQEVIFSYKKTIEELEIKSNKIISEMEIQLRTSTETNGSNQEIISEQKKTIKILERQLYEITTDIDNVTYDNADIELSDNAVHIRPHYETPKILRNPKILKWYSRASGEWIEVVVKGKIFDFEIYELLIDNELGVKDGEILFHVNEVIDNTILISTYQPEGIPFEGIRWKNENGDEYKYYISEYYTMEQNPELWKSFDLLKQ